MLSDERDLTHIDRLRIGSLHVEPPFADEDLLHEITELESEVERLQAENLRLDDALEHADAEVMRARERLGRLHDMLERVQWGNTGACPECYLLPYQGHGIDCELAAALRGDGE